VTLVDANILLYAEDARCPLHTRAREWWDVQLSGATPVCLCWPVVLAFLRISTSARVFEHPLSAAVAAERVTSWLGQPCLRIIVPSSRHWHILADLLAAGQAVGNLVSDAHLAALAIEHNCMLYSTDADFSRFPGLRWRNPLT
jgi:toxin-antitoxin system PIN domain toxin